MKTIWLLISIAGTHPATDPAQFQHAFSSKAGCEHALAEFKEFLVASGSQNPTTYVCIDIPVDDQ